jgi:hypothetical protein
MQRNNAAAIAARLMSDFATRTGLSPTAEKPRRYLWTDAFAVCNFLELFEQTGDEQYGRRATGLIDQVHQMLGRYRDDDKRSGWISGLDERAGGRHPTAGGLRIGKPLRERSINEAFDEMLEWDRDGQYFHYLTKWIHALCQAAFATNNFEYALWAVELGEAAFKGFAQRYGSGRVVGVYWKMSTDLSRPLVPATGLHDALDGLITFREAQRALAKSPTKHREADLIIAIESLSVLCQHGEWTTTDPLGLGGLLFDAGRLCQLIGDEHHTDVRLLESILEACRNGLEGILASRYLNRPIAHRLAFRELGLAIGLQALPLVTDAVKKGRVPLRNRNALVDRLLPYESLSEDIISVWLPRAQSPDEIWQAHQDINDVMLATALVADMFLSVGQRLSEA